MSSALAGVLYFMYAKTVRPQGYQERKGATSPTLRGLKVLLRPGITTFLESAIRNALYLWLVHGIVSMGSDYATAWGVFITIRWGLIMVPVQSLEATSLAFVGHAWGRWRREMGVENRRPRMSRHNLVGVVNPALRSLTIALIVEVPLCIFLALYGCRRFASYLSGSAAVADITAHMWQTIDWYVSVCHAPNPECSLQSGVTSSTLHPPSLLQYYLRPALAGIFISHCYLTFSTSFHGRSSAKYPT